MSEPDASAASAAAEILGRSGGVYAGMALIAGMRPDVFSPLAEGPLSTEALAGRPWIADLRGEP